MAAAPSNPPVIGNLALPSTPAQEWAHDAAAELGLKPGELPPPASAKTTQTEVGLNSTSNAPQPAPLTSAHDVLGGNSATQGGFVPQTTPLTYTQDVIDSNPPSSQIGYNSATQVGFAPSSASAPATPGPHLPGAYPRSMGERTGPESQTEAVDMVKGVLPAQQDVLGAVDTARSYLPAQQDVVGAVDTARSYLPAQEDVRSALVNAGETVKGYLPTAVASYFPSSPTSASKVPVSTGGVGDLPGAASETGVAKLPEERAFNKTGGIGDLPGSASETNVAQLPDERHETSVAPITSVAPVGLTSSYPQGLNSSNNQHTLSNLSTTAVAGSVHHESLPSTSASTSEYSSTAPTVNAGAVFGDATGGGVGDLPGAASETNVAVLPDERDLPEIPQAEDDTHNQRSAGVSAVLNKNAGPVGIPTRENPVQVSAMKIDTDQHEKPFPEVPQLHPDARTHPLGGDGTKWGDVPLDEKYQSELDKSKEPTTTIIDKSLPNFKDTASPITPPTASTHQSNTLSTRADAGHERVSSIPTHDSTTSRSTDSPLKNSTSAVSHDSKSSGGSGTTEGGSPRKSGFMSKVKGEMKVLSGKLGKNEEKVEEGRKMMGK